MAGRESHRTRERGNDSEREALRSGRYRRPRDTDPAPDIESDSDHERERQARRRERQRARESRDHESQDRTRNRTREPRERIRDQSAAKSRSRDPARKRDPTLEREKREQERRRQRAAQDRERIRSTSRPAAALALDTDSEGDQAQDLQRAHKKSRSKRRQAQPVASDSEVSVSVPVVVKASRKSARQRDRSKSRGRYSTTLLMDDVGASRSLQEPGSGVKRRVVSGAYMEEGQADDFLRGGASSPGSYNEKLHYVNKRKHTEKSCMSWFTKKRMIILGIVGAVILIIVVVAVAVSSKKKASSSSGSGPSSSSNNEDQVPIADRNTDMDPGSWYDTTDFNTTYTNVTVGGLPIIGLFSTWNDSARANENVPALDEDWGNYTSRPIRGVNLGGWLSIEPFITPSLFNYPLSNGIIDEWTLCGQLGGSKKSTLEKHYATFITESDFKAIADAGIDHVRIPYSYWAVEVYEGDQYLYRTSWRYLLRGLEWARKYGLRVNLDLHGIPGSQNGWNHSGRQGLIGWLNGTDGALNAQRSLDIHNRLSQFFAQDRYKNLIAFYGLVNEPKMTALEPSAVVNWTQNAYKIVHDNGVKAPVVFGDGFMGLANWKGIMTGYGNSLILDVHQYVIFNTNQIVFTHAEKVQYACSGWTNQSEQSMSTSTGFGPTIVAEWSQADTDCTKFLTNVGWGNRWEGTYDTGITSTSILTPRCPAENSSCSCTNANAGVSSWSAEYKAFLKDFAEAQMYSFEKTWGWWYWTWKTESAPQWSYQAGLAAGVLPEKAYSRSFDCSNIPTSYPGLSETY
ncbi:hypothetical protein TD95_001524 [Thielaviopsis punctulata]|uniref:glucan 1,3-beta-glucosidase n=1 Tax=Thielaviopsis punctulata TaxID=72032 RepID=A0A0F4ZIV6_9PEZI|nr:hypothetical protein TD95_001524 [Thielaviopsis punctulata]